MTAPGSSPRDLLGQATVRYGPLEQFYDEDRQVMRLVRKRYETWSENGKKFGRRDYVPANHSEADARVAAVREQT